eukprot:13261780-Alexandrium_andersonii.AAC.1
MLGARARRRARRAAAAREARDVLGERSRQGQAEVAQEAPHGGAKKATFKRLPQAEDLGNGERYGRDLKGLRGDAGAGRPEHALPD